MPLFDQMPLHVHGDVTHTGAQTGYQQYQRQNWHRTSQRDYRPAAQQEGGRDPADRLRGVPVHQLACERHPKDRADSHADQRESQLCRGGADLVANSWNPRERGGHHQSIGKEHHSNRKRRTYRRRGAGFFRI